MNTRKSSYEVEQQLSEGVSWVAVAFVLAGISLAILTVGYKAASWLDTAPANARAVQGGR